MEFEDHHDQQEESLQGMESLGISPSSNREEEEAPLPMTMMLPHHHHHPLKTNITPKGKYRECLKNHAVSIGGHALDGCGEFMPAGPDGSLDALKCAACNCHRNFHRKETRESSYFLTHHHHAPSPPPYYRSPAGYLHVTAPPGQQRMMAALALPPSMSDQDDDVSNRKKRFRTKFTAEQKEKMVGLAERIGWRIQKQDEDLVKEFCEESGIKRQVFKVWMHNNKLTLGNKKP